MTQRSLKAIIEGILDYGKFLPGKTNHSLEVLILRGHLLVEREIHRLILEKFERPQAYDLSKMPFFAALQLAEALYGSKVPDWIWGDIKELNNIRSSLAHHLIDDLRAPKIKRFIARVREREKKTFAFVDKTVPKQLAYCIAHLHHALLKVGHPE